MSELSALKVGGAVLFSFGLFWSLFCLISRPASWPSRYWGQYEAYLDRRLRLMFLPARGRLIVWNQFVGAWGIVALALLLQRELVCLALLPWALGPSLYLEQRRRYRVRAIEGKIDGFVLALANALKATPSIGNALNYTLSLLAPPLDVEVALALKEMRLGSTVDQALLNMAGRVRSTQVDAALSGLLIGRQVGGDLPKILEKTAETLREMARLQGVVRSKTAEGRAQLGVLAVFPILMLFMFDTVSQGYFDPLTDSIFGWGVITLAIALWIGSLLMARSILAVEI